MQETTISSGIGGQERWGHSPRKRGAHPAEGQGDDRGIDSATTATATRGADRQLLIDGKLLGTSRTFPSLNPATGEVLGHAPDATVGD
ncbi:MAG: hypothetical protein ACXWD8_18025, partial [Mycobacterium sp.]